MAAITLLCMIACLLLHEPFRIALAVKIERSKLPLTTSTTIATPVNDSSTIQTSSTVLARLSTTTRKPESITTTQPPSTSVKPKSSIAINSTKHDLKSEKSIGEMIAKSDNCPCDVYIHYCDVNCCCDVNCTQEMLKSFLCQHQQYTKNSDLQQGLPACDINDGWLCILKDNSMKENIERYDTDFTPSRIYSWSNFLPDEEQPVVDREYLMYGDEIILYNDRSNDVKTLDLPSALINSHCHVFESVRHMINIMRTCTMTSEDFVNFYVSFFEDITSYKLLRNRKDTTNNGAHMYDDAASIKMFICNLHDDMMNCVKVENETSLPNAGCWKLNINIRHNFTYLLGMDVSLVCTDIQELPTNFATSFNVNFLRPNETDAIEPKQSINSNYGYQPGMPIITANLFAVNDVSHESEDKYVISYFHENNTIRTKHAEILLPFSDSGHCSDVLHEPIKFGENTLTQFSVAIANNSLLGADSNFTRICEQLQGTLFQYLVNDENYYGDYNLYVSELGRPQNISSNWIRIDTRNYEHRQVTGIYDVRSNSFRCINILLSVYYEFIISRVALNGQLHQSIIKKAAVIFGDRVNLKFNLEEELSIPVSVYTRFHDATKNFSPSQTPTLYLLNIILLVILLFDI